MKYILIAFLLWIYSCNQNIDSDFVRNNIWSYEGGFKLGKGDFIIFGVKEKMIELKGDTIYYEGFPKATIERFNLERHFMKIKSLQSGQIGSYVVQGYNN